MLILLLYCSSVQTADDPDVSESSPASRARARFIEVISLKVDIVTPRSDWTVFAGLPTVGICASGSVDMLMIHTGCAMKHSITGLWTGC
jgi:hypothetical protein